MMATALPSYSAARKGRKSFRKSACRRRSAACGSSRFDLGGFAGVDFV
jgi:hypothetical protein